jgi:hypothetical protein
MRFLFSFNLFVYFLFQARFEVTKATFLRHLQRLDDSIQSYLTGKAVAFQVSVSRSLFHSIVDFASEHLPTDNTPHIRSKFYSALENVLERNFPDCVFGSSLSDTKRIVSNNLFTYLLM